MAWLLQLLQLLNPVSVSGLQIMNVADKHNIQPTSQTSVHYFVFVTNAAPHVHCIYCQPGGGSMSPAVRCRSCGKDPMASCTNPSVLRSTLSFLPVSPDVTLWAS